jgi:hypothetical protein
MKARRETFLIVGLLVVLVVITAAAAFVEAGQGVSLPLSSGSNAPDGARALSLWLSAAGYRVENQPAIEFSIPPGSQAALVLEPSVKYEFTAPEWAVLEGWVRQGGILLVAAIDLKAALQGNPFGIVIAAVPAKTVNLFPSAPIFSAPALSVPASLKINSVIASTEPAGSVLLATPEGPVAVQIPYGKGQVMVVAGSSFLTNAGLRNPGDADLMLNLVSQVPPGSAVFIDEWHHGERAAASTASGLEGWLAETPAGQAVLFAAVIIFLGLVLSGRPFGRPLAPAVEQSRRGPLEYVNAMANLYHRAGHRRAVMDHYHTGLKRSLGKRYRLDPSLPDPEFVNRLAGFNPELDRAALLDLLGRLSQKSFSEIQMVQLARAAAGWMTTFELKEHL